MKNVVLWLKPLHPTGTWVKVMWQCDFNLAVVLIT